MTRLDAPRSQRKAPVILKFGGSFLRGHGDLIRAVHIIYAEVRRGRTVVAVTSAFHGRTDELDAVLGALEEGTTGSSGDPRQARFRRAALLGTGEQETAALLAATLERAGIPTRTANVAVTGPFVAPGTEEPTGLDVESLMGLFSHASVVCLPGFIGVEEGAGRHPALLGRGGSDLTAVFVGQRLGAPVSLIKDVNGLYSSDPSRLGDTGEPPRRLARASYGDAASLGDDVLQPRALAFAEAHGQSFHVVGPGVIHGQRGTTVGPLSTVAWTFQGETAPVRVALLGLGTVGARVLTELSAEPDQFDVTAILVKDPHGKERPVAARGRITQSFDEVLASAPEILIEVTEGAEPAGDWIRRALQSQIHVVSANDVAIAAMEPPPERLARAAGVLFRGSAAVGGSVPVLERIRAIQGFGPRDSRVVGVTGILNGTTHAVLDGSDLVHQLTLVAREAGWLSAPGAEFTFKVVEGIAEGVFRAALEEAAAKGKRLRLLGSVVGGTAAGRRGALGRVELVAVGPASPFFQAEGAANVVCVERSDGSTEVLRGLGAGAWPTATAVVGDVREICRKLHRRRTSQIQGH